MPPLVGLEAGVLTAYVACLVVLFVFSMGQLHLLVSYRRVRSGAAVTAAPVGTSLPGVTVQLPVYNERHVVERLIDAAAALDYPADRLSIQVLDDSDDVTTVLAASRVAHHRRHGIDIAHVRRGDRHGYKAGALAHGLATSSGDLVAVFDADFVPRADFLRRTVGFFAEPQVAAVQTRWEHHNRGESALTRMQGFLLDLHFRLEQPARFATGRFGNFNGTAGLWRRTAVDDAGGWSARTITEDIDLSYRAQLRGWRIVYLRYEGCPSELPAEMSGFRGQQYRWLKGGAQNARLHLRSVLGSGLPRHVRWHAAQHLLAGSAYLAILGMLVLTVPLAALKNSAIGVDYADFGVPFLASTIALFPVFAAAADPPPRGARGMARFTARMVAFLVFTMGLAVHNGTAVASGWLGRPSPFVRTPKYGSGTWITSAYAGRGVDRRLAAECGVLGLLVLGVVVGLRRDVHALLPTQLMGIAGLVWVIGLSVAHPLRARRRATTRDTDDRFDVPRPPSRPHEETAA